MKIFPCCYALQRPIFVIREILGAHRLTPDQIAAIEVRAAQSTVKPLIHHRPLTGAQGKFSLEYGVAAAILDDFPGQWSFTDPAVSRDGPSSFYAVCSSSPAGPAKDCSMVTARSPYR